MKIDIKDINKMNKNFKKINHDQIIKSIDQIRYLIKLSNPDNYNLLDDDNQLELINYLIDQMIYNFDLLILNLDFYFDSILKDYNQDNKKYLDNNPHYQLLKSIKSNLINHLNYDTDINDQWIIYFDDQSDLINYLDKIEYQFNQIRIKDNN